MKHRKVFRKEEKVLLAVHSILTGFLSEYKAQWLYCTLAAAEELQESADPYYHYGNVSCSVHLLQDTI